MLRPAICPLVVVGLMVFPSHAMQESQRKLVVDTAVEPKLDRIENALAQFVAVHRRLPCPARISTPNLESINLATGLCTPTTQLDGVVPYATLGLAEADVIDPWLGRISYRVQPSLASNLMTLMNMSWCDSAGAPTAASGASMPCTSPCTGAACMHPSNYLYGKGLQVQDASALWLNQPSPAWDGTPGALPAATGAAYVLVSHGPNGLGAYNSVGAFVTGAAGQEAQNRNNLALTGASMFVDSARTASFDDVLRHPTIGAVLARASLADRTPH